MNRKKTSIPTLLAGRVRPMRKPPEGLRYAASGSDLRLSYGEAASEMEALPSPSIESGAVREDVEPAASAVCMAKSAVERIASHLGELEILLRPDKVVRRMSPKEIHKAQASIDATLRAIEECVNTTTIDGGFLLKGRWSIVLADVTSGKQRTFRPRSMEPGRLGNSCAGFLSAARSGGARSLSKVGLVAVHSLVVKAAAQVSQEREAFLAFSKETIEPLLDALEVVTENISASDNAVSDVDLAIKISRLTRMDVLLASTAEQPRGHHFGSSPVLKIVWD